MYEEHIHNHEFYEIKVGGDEWVLYVSEDAIAIPSQYFDALINHPELTEFMQHARNRQEEIFSIDDRSYLTINGDPISYLSWGCSRQERYQMWNALLDEKGEVIDGDFGYLSIVHYDCAYMRKHKTNWLLVHTYIDKEWHDREITELKAQHNQALRAKEIEVIKRFSAESPQSILKDVERLITEKVQTGISEGVQKAIEKGTATLKDIQTEKSRIKEQLKQLEDAEKKAQLREAIAAQREREKQAGRKVKIIEGYVYVLKQIGGIYYKIGHTSNPEQRKRNFDVKLPFAVEYDILIKTDNRYLLERELHTRFSSKRADGEWFQLDADDLDYLRQLAASE